jgi:hypothetical protein
MARTMEMFIAGTALIVDLVTIMLMYFVQNAILGPLTDIVERMVGAYPQVFPISDMTYVIQGIWVFLILFAIVCVIAFVVVAGRTTVVDDYV